MCGFTGAATAILLFASALLHELGHSAAARRYHFRVRRITRWFFGGVAAPRRSVRLPVAVAGPLLSAARVTPVMVRAWQDGLRGSGPPRLAAR